MLFRLTREAALAEDLTQDTLLRMYRARKSFRAGEKVLPWAYTIARRLFVDRARHRRNEREMSGLYVDCPPLSAVPRADEEITARRMAFTVDDVLDRLPRRQAEAFRLVKTEGLSLTEASAKLGDSNLSVRLRTHRACQAIRRALEEHWQLPREQSARSRARRA
jgi:RNA polymerase sigma-70 factor (ECF subfamily)